MRHYKSTATNSLIDSQSSQRHSVTIVVLKCYIFIIATQCIDATMLLQKAKQTNAAIQHHMTQWTHIPRRSCWMNISLRMIPPVLTVFWTFRTPLSPEVTGFDSGNDTWWVRLITNPVTSLWNFLESQNNQLLITIPLYSLPIWSGGKIARPDTMLTLDIWSQKVFLVPFAEMCRKFGYHYIWLHTKMLWERALV